MLDPKVIEISDDTINSSVEVIEISSSIHESDTNCTTVKETACRDWKETVKGSNDNSVIDFRRPSKRSNNLFILSSSPVASPRMGTTQKRSVINALECQLDTCTYSKKTDILDLKNWISESDDSGVSNCYVSNGDGSQWEPSSTTLPKVSQTSDAIDDQSSSFPSDFNLLDEMNTHANAKCTALPKKESKKKSNNTLKVGENTFSLKVLRTLNKVSRKKEDLLSEMIIEVPSFVEKDYFKLEYLRQVFAGTEISLIDSSLPLISWRRKLRSEYDSNADLFVPCEPKKVKERVLVLYFKAQEFTNYLRTGEINKLLDDCKADFKLSYLHSVPHIIFMVEGYDNFLNKLKAHENLKYKSAVLGSMNCDTQVKKRRKQNTEDVIDQLAKEIEYMANEAEVQLGVNIFPVKNSSEAVEWLHSFTYTISNALYDKFNRNESLANLGTVRSGSDLKSTFLQTMKQFNLMTEPRAEKLFGYFGSLSSVYSKYRFSSTLGTDAQGKNIVPPSTDLAMRKLFTSHDPNEIIYE
ncbi:uncharacterized protein PRCAT00001909001 [Priceomyces carsonii]|uniref:uncharacterized protein n=1 Tax=Priceomyces carsonii TaxID=28549 RepID=UPI002ED8448D|nr:unnamed protein product [Priceomyces carsonii]